MHLHSFQVTEFKLHRIVNDYPETGRGGVDDSTLPPRGVRNKGLITQKTLNRRAFAQFSSYRVQTSQDRQRLPGTGRGGVDNSTLPPEGSEIKG